MKNLTKKEMRRLLKVSQYGLWKWTQYLDYDFVKVEIKDVERKDMPIILYCTRRLMKMSSPLAHECGKYIKRSYEELGDMIPY